MIGPYYGVQVRNRLWLMEKTKLPGGRLPAALRIRPPRVWSSA